MTESKERIGRFRQGIRAGGYTVVQNSLISDLDLSVEARVLMIYLLSRPEDWELQIGDVRRFLGIRGKPCGRDKAYRIVSELKQRRYLVMCEDVREGHFAGVTYYIFDRPVSDAEEIRKAHRETGNGLNPMAETPLPDFQEADRFPRADFPIPENQEVTNKRYKQTTDTPKPPNPHKSTRRKALEKGGSNAPIPSGVILPPWSREWMAYRTHLLMNGREQAPGKPTRFLAQLMAKPGKAGKRARLDHQAKTCWPTVQAMDRSAVEQARGWRAPSEFDAASAAERYHSVDVDGDEFRVWQDEHVRRGWPEVPKPEGVKKIWIPVDWLSSISMPNAHAEDAA